MHELKIFMTEESLIELEEEYIDKPEDLRNLVFGYLLKLTKEAKSTLRNKQFGANVIDTEMQEDKGGNPQKVDKIKLKNYDLKKCTRPLNPDWIPENLEKDDCKVYKIKVGNKTFERLVVYGQLHEARVRLYCKNLDESVPGFDEDRDKPKPAECLEQIIHEQCISHIVDILDKIDEKEQRAEFKEINDPDAKKKEDRKGKSTSEKEAENKDPKEEPTKTD